MSFRLYNTLSGQVEDLRPLSPPEVRMYACGPTVYARAHIGNFRTFVANDVLRRALSYGGYRVRGVMNLTDVDDRIIKLAAEAGQEIGPFTSAHIAAFREDMKALRLEPPEVVPKATEHIPEMVELIQKLIERGHTYVADGSVYFRIGSFPAYGRLARLDVSGMKAGARVDTDKYEKEDARDFVLWKLKADEPAWAQWDAPFGKGRPGWHIECSAMGMKYLGETFDVHCGGVDLIFPHHENEIAQSECGTGHPFVRHWMHVEHLLVNEETMSKSKGNFFTLPDLVEAGHAPEAVRYLLAQAHYRKQLNFSFEGLDQAKAALERIHGVVRRLGEVDAAGSAAAPVLEAGERAEAAFAAALRDDLNTPEAIAAVHGLVTEANQLLAAGAVNAGGAGALRERFERMDRVFAVLLPAGEDRLEPELQALFDGRQEARRARDFRRADELRGELERRGIVLEDTPRGTRWRRR
ncbi:MAG: cysteine--tRNA ligase [Vicinamibacteria bacterium]|nr:cysteine--tRNA ligase [Vicinamibacteria bacterium]